MNLNEYIQHVMLTYEKAALLIQVINVRKIDIPQFCAAWKTSFLATDRSSSRILGLNESQREKI